MFVACSIVGVCSGQRAGIAYSGSEEEAGMIARDLKRVYDLPYTEISQGPIVIEQNEKNSRIFPISEKQRMDLNSKINNFISILSATNFKDYYNLLKNDTESMIKLNNYGKKKIRKTLTGMMGENFFEDIKEEELLEMYWVLETQMVDDGDYILGIAVNDSVYTINENYTKAVGTEVHSEIKKLCPSLGSHHKVLTVFDRSKDNIDNAFWSFGKLLIADVVLFVHTNVEDIGFPIVIRYWWNNTIQEWNPWFVAYHISTKELPNYVY